MSNAKIIRVSSVMTQHRISLEYHQSAGTLEIKFESRSYVFGRYPSPHQIVNRSKSHGMVSDMVKLKYISLMAISPTAP